MRKGEKGRWGEGNPNPVVGSGGVGVRVGSRGAFASEHREKEDDATMGREERNGEVSNYIESCGGAHMSARVTRKQKSAAFCGSGFLVGGG